MSGQVFKRVPSVEVAPLKDESVLFNPDTNRFCLLNKTMAFIWERLESAASAEDISTALAGSFAGISRTQAQADVTTALSQLVELGLASASNTAD
jgi:hypothetical protein